MSTSRTISYESAGNIIKNWGYSSFTQLQDVVFKNCSCGENAREFIIGSTSSGKTLVPLVCYKNDKYSVENRNKLLYMVPYRALASQKEKEFKNKFQGEKIIVSTSEYCSEDINVSNGYCDIAIVIYEKVFLFLSKNKKFLEQYTHIVFDELGIVESRERGLKVDYILFMACKYTKNNIYVLATPYFNWNLYISTYSFNKHEECTRPIIIKETLEKIDNSNNIKTLIYNLCKKHRNLNHKILIFANSRSLVQDLARDLYHRFADKKEGFDANVAKRKFLSKLIMTEDDLFGIMEDEDYLAYAEGIAFHNAAVPEEIRELIEKEFLEDNSQIDIVIATETLAYGINSNVDVVIVAEMEKPIGGKNRRFLTVNEYQNFIGRTGRLGKKDIGYAYTFLYISQQTEWNNLVSKIKVPDIISSQYKELRKRDERIFYLLNFFKDTEGIEAEFVLKALKSFPCSHVSANDNNDVNFINKSINQLLLRRLIKEQRDVITKSLKYKTTMLGEQVTGFIISIETYDRLQEAKKFLFNNNKILIFDFLYEICKCKEMQINDYIDKRDLQKYKRHLRKLFKELQSRGKVSECYKEKILRDPLINKFDDLKNEFGYREYDAIRQVRAAEALYMWMECNSVKEIKDVCGFDYANVKKMGEKAKYITDVISSGIALPKDVEFLGTIIKRIGLSLYYGIKIEMLDKLNVTELEPIAGRQLRTIGRIINLRNSPLEKNNEKIEAMLNQIKQFPEEYKELREEDLND